ncbi:glucosaminidase domain-containing protein [Paenibacillus sp. MER TA 81-3]|uniref:glucosaminidase domain-containing protein n=1 Tax=Paenibacillus sp. MER TA 81-3 TaxID=2939573 RepID=UPI00203FF98B|nr:glucosaminidase domain-containing protein [Paenibacillus sp. MER TA 81-3]MCM3339223.1 glucosaminidase domain-containing protein [Paenibacillus sp. MER TA 81-3]
MVYVQFGHETGYLYRDGRSAAGIDATYCNPCGLKVTAGGGDTQAAAHKRFANWREGITAHLDHLALYAGASGYPRDSTPDPRHFSYLKGTARTVEALGGKWAPSSTYGHKLVQYLKEVQAMKNSRSKRIMLTTGQKHLFGE